MNSPKAIVVCGLLVRFFCLAFLFHPDLKSQAFHAQFLSRGVVNIYSYVQSHKSQLPYQDTFNYPPLAYLLLGAQYSFAENLIGPTAQQWINDWGASAQTHTSMLAFIALFKLPYLFCDLLVISLLCCLTPRPRRPVITALWAFNPILLYGVYAVGQFDLVPTLLTLTAVLLLRRHRPFTGGVMLGLGIALKTFPLLLLPLVAIAVLKPQTKMRFFTGILLPVVLFLGPAYADQTYRTVQASAGLVSRILEPQLLEVPLMPIVICFVYVVFFLRRRSSDLLVYSGVIFLLATNLIRFHAQWGIWSVPFLLPFISRHKIIFWVYALMLAAFFGYIFLLPDQYVIVGLFSGLLPALATIPNLASRLPRVETFKLLMHPLLVIATSATVALLLFCSHTQDQYKNSVPKVSIFGLLLVSLSVVFGTFLLSTTLLLKYVPLPVSTSAQRLIAITPESPLTQSFTIPFDGLSQINLFLKNPRIANRLPLKFELLSQSGQPLRELVLNGSNVPDGGDVTLRFPPLTDSANRPLVFRLSTSTAADNESQIQVGAALGTPQTAVFQPFYTPTHRLQPLQVALPQLLAKTIFHPAWILGLLLYWGLVIVFLRSQLGRVI